MRHAKPVTCSPCLCMQRLNATAVSRHQQLCQINHTIPKPTCMHASTLHAQLHNLVNSQTNTLDTLTMKEGVQNIGRTSCLQLSNSTVKPLPTFTHCADSTCCSQHHAHTAAGAGLYRCSAVLQRGTRKTLCADRSQLRCCRRAVAWVLVSQHTHGVMSLPAGSQHSAQPISQPTNSCSHV